MVPCIIDTSGQVMGDSRAGRSRSRRAKSDKANAHWVRRLVVFAGAAALAFNASAALGDASSTEHWGDPGVFGVLSTRYETDQLRYPVVGYALPASYAQNHAADDFCYYDANHAYSNNACTQHGGKGHAGNDLIPTWGVTNSTQASYDQLRVIATRNGTVATSTCGSGAGQYVVIKYGSGSSIRYQWYEHLGARYVAVNGSVVAGEKIGLLGKSDQSDCGGNSATHLHLEIHKGGNTRSTQSYDPYKMLERWHATPGRQPGTSGSNANPLVDARLLSAWKTAIDSKGGYPTASGGNAGSLRAIGWPGGYGYGSASVYSSTSGATGASGYKQYLVTGDCYKDPTSSCRGGITMHKSSASSGYVVHGTIFTVYADMGTNDMERSWLGWPTSGEFKNDGRTQQNFEGGCIAYWPAAGTYIAAYLTSSVCT